MGKPKWLKALKSKIHRVKSNKTTGEGENAPLNQTQTSNSTNAQAAARVHGEKFTSEERAQALAILKSRGFSDLERKNRVETTDMRNAFVWALNTGNEVAVQLLIERGLDVKAASQAPPLHIAARNGDKSLVKLLLDHGANIHAVDSFGKTAFAEACRQGHHEIVKMLLEGERGFVVRNGYSLHKAAWDGDELLVQLLLDKGADMHLKDGHERTPLSYACGMGHASTARVLIDRGAHMMEGDNMNRTPLHKAAQNGCEEVVALLLEKGADIDDKDRFGKTALHRAAEQVMKTTGVVQERYENVVCLLIKGGADVLNKDRDGRTPLKLLKGENGKRPLSNKLETLLRNGREKADDEARPTEKAAVFKKKEAKGIQLEPTVLKQEVTAHGLDGKIRAKVEPTVLKKEMTGRRLGDWVPPEEREKLSERKGSEGERPEGKVPARNLPTAKTLPPSWKIPPMILPPGGHYSGRSRYERETGFVDPAILRWD